MAAVHPFPEIWTQPSLGVGPRGRGANAVKGGKWMLMDLISLSFWSYYPVASGTAELSMNGFFLFFFSPAKSIPHFVSTEYGGTDIYCFLNFFLSYSQIPCPRLLEAVVKYDKLTK